MDSTRRVLTTKAGTKQDLIKEFVKKDIEEPSKGAASTCLVLTTFMVILNGSSSWCLGRAAVCDCGTPPPPWTFLLPFSFF